MDETTLIMRMQYMHLKEAPSVMRAARRTPRLNRLLGGKEMRYLVEEPMQNEHPACGTDLRWTRGGNIASFRSPRRSLS